MLVDPVSRQRGKVVGGQLDRSLVLSALSSAFARESSSSWMRSLTSPRRPAISSERVARHERLVQLAEPPLVVRGEGADSTAAALVVQPLGEDLGLAQALQHPPGFAELLHRRAQFEADLERLLQRRLTLWQRLEDAQRLFEAGARVLGRRPSRRLESGLPEIVNRLFPQLTPEGVIGEPLDLLAETIRAEASRSHRRSAREARGGEPVNSPLYVTSCVRACLKQYARSGESPVSSRNSAACNRSSPRRSASAARSAIASRRANGTSLPTTEATCRRRLSSGARRSIRAASIAWTVSGTWRSARLASGDMRPALSRQDCRLDQRADTLLDEERVAFGALDHQPLDGPEGRVVFRAGRPAGLPQSPPVVGRSAVGV